HRVVARIRLGPCHPALGVVHVAEGDRLRRTDLLARRADLTVAERAALAARVDAPAVYALQAVRALLHDAAAPHRHVGIALQLEALGRPVGEEEEVEAPHLVGAVVRAVAGADAAVVDHDVQAFAVVHGRVHRTHDLAWGPLAMLAEHRLEVRIGRVELARVVAVQPDPLHLAAVRDLLASDDRDVVLGLAGDDARVAPDAGVQIDRHRAGGAAPGP